MNPKQLEQDASANLPDIIVHSDARRLVAQARQLGQAFGSRRSSLELKTSQIRAIFGTVRQIDMSWHGESDEVDAHRRLILLKPKMQYRAAKAGRQGKGLEVLANVLGEAIDLVVETPQEADEDADGRKRFDNFVDFFEAILAYHRVAGGS